MRYTLLLLLLAPCAALAQADAEAEAAARKRAEQRLRQYRDLGLSDDQKAKIVELFVVETTGSDRLTEERRKKMFALLDDAQDEKYRVMLARTDKRYHTPEIAAALERDRQRRDNDNQLRMVGLDSGRYAEPLGLDDAARTKLAGLLQVAADRLRKMRAEQGKRWDYDLWRAFALTLRREIRPQIAELLTTDAQRQKFAEINKTWDDQVNGYYERWKERQGRRQPKVEDPAKEVERLLAEAMKALALGDEEAAAMRPLLASLIRHIVIGGRSLAERRARVAKQAADQTAARTALASYRELRAAHETKLAQLQGQVLELLTVEQEARLVALDLLP